ncbi:DUF3052 domain-containing protein [Peribacillus cavernae]|uniref:DUF3052 domain-containing protein n=1 Tax=Peribacillus cavernae TaxID=1674310 RepID=A0A433HI93_9BACI|nr:DUF3052 domain-containing protein [Peribacillus cavernae]MDQ0220993.1 hypothetical protein [Peribacillus cavernae]RUQ27913.1 DUF3052 domain-containing protein [Peribacillus cavernae]
MPEFSPVLKKLQFKDQGQPVLILNAPHAYDEVIASFLGEVHQVQNTEVYDFVQVFGTTNAELQTLARKASKAISEDGLLWLCYPKKSSKAFKGSDCSRETVTGLLADEGYEPVRQIAIDEDWSALRFRLVDKIKTLTRDFAVTEKGVERTQQQ